MSITKRIQTIRATMAKYDVDAYIIPSSDPHQSEYVADHWASRAWISGFTGSAGLVVITSDHAGLWTDSRYFIQAEQELKNTGITLHRLGVPHTPEHVEWLTQHLFSGARIGLDGTLFSVQQIRWMQRAFEPFDLQIDYAKDFISEIWTDRPPRPLHPISEMGRSYTGMSRRDKLVLIRSKMAEQAADHYLISTLDDIAWVLNLRGKDVLYNPVFVAYLVLGRTLGYLFVDHGKLDDQTIEKLQSDGIQLRPYDQVTAFLTSRKKEDIFLVDLASTHIIHYDALVHTRLRPGKNIIQPLKAIKTDAEIAHIRSAMRKDGIALTRFYRWLEETLAKEQWPTEYEAGRKLDFFRKQQPGYQGESFSAIVGFKGNGAIVHYRPDEDKSATIGPEGMLLIDSGGQYIDGTTDITRTIFLGTPLPEHCQHYTLVLKGHIALSRQKFPAGTTGVQLDTLARQFLWQNALNYGHGTGHGVGYYLNVHEGPQSISPNPKSTHTQTAIEPGMITSNEPGLYIPDAYGIRIENLVLCIKKEETAFGKFYAFVPLTLFPIDTNLIDINLLGQEEVEWINNYHQSVYSELSAHLEEEEIVWLLERCRPISLPAVTKD